MHVTHMYVIAYVTIIATLVSPQVISGSLKTESTTQFCRSECYLCCVYLNCVVNFLIINWNG